MWVKFPVARVAVDAADGDLTSLRVDLVDRAVGRDLDDDALDAAGQPRDQLLAEDQLRRFTRSPMPPPENWAKLGDTLILADNLAGEVFKQARVTAYEQIARVCPPTCSPA